MIPGKPTMLLFAASLVFPACTPPKDGKVPDPVTQTDSPSGTDTEDPVDTGLEPQTETGTDTAADTGVLSPLGLAFAPIDSQHLSFGATWCGFGYDGRHVAISVEQGGTIEGALFSLEGQQLQHQSLLAGPTDTLSGQRIADHKHVQMDEHHYIVFSNEGHGSGGELILMKLNQDLERTQIVHIETDDPPTNDMLLVTDGLTLSVGKFLPGVGHRIYQFDADLQLLDSVPIGHDEAMHANGAAAVFADGVYHLVAPMTLQPTVNRQYQHLVFDEHWGLISGPEVVLERDFLGMVTALEYEDETGFFIAHYNEDTAGVGGNIHRLVFDGEWELLEDTIVAEGEFARPHTVVVPGEIWLGYDANGEVWLHRFSMSVVEQ